MLINRLYIINADYFTGSVAKHAEVSGFLGKFEFDNAIQLCM